MTGKLTIEENLKKIVEKIAGKEIPVELQISEKRENGDYYTNVALKLASILKKKPGEIAEEIKSEFEKIALDSSNPRNDNVISKIEIAGPGFVNFFFSEKALIETMNAVLENEKFGNSDTNQGKGVVVEFSSPNIAKPFTVGHLRSTIIGAAVANLLEATGWEVFRDNHLGDWGTQFGKQIYAIKTWGDEKKIEVSENPVKDLVELYVKFHEEAEKDPKLEDEGRAWFKKLEEGDPEARLLWQKCIDWSVREFGRLYEILGVTFTENNGMGYGESFFENKMSDILDELNSKNLLKKHEGAELVYFPEDKYPPLMILKQDGATLYSTRDLATDKFRLQEHGPDTVIINEVGVEQSLYFNQLYELEKMLGWVKNGQRIHIKHGHFRFAEGKMSTRKGNVVWLEDVLKEAEKRASLLSDDSNSNSNAVAMGALKWNDLKRNSIQDITFDWDDILNMQGNSGPYIQYTYVRTQSVIKKGKGESVKGKVYSEEKLNPEEIAVLRQLVYFPEIVEFAAITFSPNLVCNYLFELAQTFNLFYQKHQILNIEDTETRAFRLFLTAATGRILKNGLQLLGISTVDKM